MLLLQVADAPRGDELVTLLADAMRREAEIADKAQEDRAALRAVRRVEAKGMAARKRRTAMHEFLYSSPMCPKAGTAVEVFYRPEATVLRGRWARVWPG